MIDLITNFMGTLTGAVDTKKRFLATHLPPTQKCGAGELCSFATSSPIDPSIRTKENTNLKTQSARNRSSRLRKVIMKILEELWGRLFNIGAETGRLCEGVVPIRLARLG